MYTLLYSWYWMSSCTLRRITLPSFSKEMTDAEKLAQGHQLVQIIHFQIWWNSKFFKWRISQITSKSPRELAKRIGEIPERIPVPSSESGCRSTEGSGKESTVNLLGPSSLPPAKFLYDLTFKSNSGEAFWTSFDSNSQSQSFTMLLNIFHSCYNTITILYLFV